MAYAYYIVLAADDVRNCGIEELPEALQAKGWRVTEGRAMEDRYPRGVTFRMGEHFPGIVVPDVIQNFCGYFMVSARLRAALEDASGAEIEFLPFTLLNHKARVAADPCYIANVIGVVDCVDTVRTEAVASELEPELFMWLKELHLTPGAIDPDVKLFRLEQMPHVMVMREDLREALEGQGMTGMKFIPTGEPCMVQ